MLFDKLDNNGDGRIDDSELEWMRKTFKVDIPTSEPLNMNEYMSLFLRCCMPKMEDPDCSLQSVLLALLSLLQGFRLQSGSSLDEPMGTLLVAYWVSHELDCISRELLLEGLPVTVRVPEGDLATLLRHELADIPWSTTGDGIAAMLTGAEFKRFVLYALGMIHDSDKCEEAVLHLMVSMGGELSEIHQFASQAKLEPLSLFECGVAEFWQGCDTSGLLDALVSTLKHFCQAQVEQQAEELSRAFSSTVDFISLSETAARFANSF
eukprot:TRINITY_DN20139_c0_g2_i1.p1 TRINITY_DN20139_c0_g2~~TRINITY_DN20139_c0_g2_i1.p1  ORF type:complete len:265 (-),score=70.20 TRINITY_DN20139_c0_g2_i1:288-1082(-)